jgi:iron complex outermembrane recepter protein
MTQPRPYPQSRHNGGHSGRSLLSLVAKVAMAFAVSVSVSVVRAEEQVPVQQDLTSLSLEELMDVEVTSVSKKSQKLSETAAAVFVITQEDIRRSGMTSIPELLRMVPGLEVARLTANKWAISARGFNGQFANKLLVMIDGRSVYTPLFSGVFWDVQDVLLEDIERIEVVRGPGGTLWGVNAVNGVINIITKRAQETQGGLVIAGGGNLEQGFGGLRYGGKIGDHGAYRLYGKYFNRDHHNTAAGGAANNEWDQGRIGFRTDWEASSQNTFTLQGDAYSGVSDQTILTTALSPAGSVSNMDSVDVRGGNVLLRWDHLFSPSSKGTIQLYYDRTERQEQVIDIIRDTFDLDAHHQFDLGNRQQIVWGLGYRLSQDQITNSFTTAVNPNRFDLEILNAFVQDEISLIPNQLRVTLGTKVSYNTFTDLEFQPNVRALWKPHPSHTLWGAVSRAVRLPSRMDRAGRFNVAAFPGAPTLVSVLGNGSLESEEVVAYELGYRSFPLKDVSVDVAAFYNVYRKLLSNETQPTIFEMFPAPAHLRRSTATANRLNGNSYGIEIATRWQALPPWKIHVNYTWLRLELSPDSQGADTASANETGNSPRHQIQVRSLYDLPYNASFDTSLFYVSSLPNLMVPSYIRVDARLGWRPMDRLEVSVVGQNLFDNQHPENSTLGGTGGTFMIGGITASEVPRSGYVKFTVWF